jgi:hypothetical protein
MFLYNKKTKQGENNDSVAIFDNILYHHLYQKGVHMYWQNSIPFSKNIRLKKSTIICIDQSGRINKDVEREDLDHVENHIDTISQLLRVKKISITPDEFAPRYEIELEFTEDAELFQLFDGLSYYIQSLVFSDNVSIRNLYYEDYYLSDNVDGAPQLQFTFGS